jgi:predicted SnoaL-like aldol condensation-catalyzing enzyme
MTTSFHSIWTALPVVLAVVAGGCAPSEPLTTREVAKGFLTQMFTDGDMRGAYEHYAAPDFIQHNPTMADGVKAHEAHFEEQAKDPHGDPKAWRHVTNMVLVDGDLFALHHEAFNGPGDPGRVFVDIWRVANGKIVEHWDVIQAIPTTMLHNNGMGCGADSYESVGNGKGTIDQPACGLPDPKANREETLKVIKDYTEAVGKGDVHKAILDWFSPDYRQHSPNIADGAQGAIDYLDNEFGRGTEEMPKAGPSRVIAEGDYAMYHRLVTYAGADRPSSNIDVFRVTNGKISEHWDVKQPVPDKSANTNGMW